MPGLWQVPTITVDCGADLPILFKRAVTGDLMKRLIDCVRLVIPVSGLLFAFLLVMPFNARFVSVSAMDEMAYSVAFVSAGLSTISLLAVGVRPVLQLARSGQPHTNLNTTRWLARIAVAGVGLLAVSFLAVAFLVSDEVYHNKMLAIGAVVCFVGAIGLTWLVRPLRSESNAAGADNSAS